MDPQQDSVPNETRSSWNPVLTEPRLALALQYRSRSPLRIGFVGLLVIAPPCSLPSGDGVVAEVATVKNRSPTCVFGGGIGGGSG
ncbi:hypothetical protein LWI28_014388 [Acer negundo]|uniref:Uncharacterized protein n=1 Tax=Acer negundo TaxID=4023 RepID=A0AAD5P5B0_ACENE|nr:hypothetical protein LWI28_014388 [Acer negundo]